MDPREVLDDWEGQARFLRETRRSVDSMYRYKASDMEWVKKEEWVVVKGIDGLGLLADIEGWAGRQIVREMMGRGTNSQQLVFLEWFTLEMITILGRHIRWMTTREDKSPTRVSLSVIGELISLLDKNNYVQTEDSPPILTTRLIRKQMNAKPLKHQREFLGYYNKTIPRYGLEGAILATPPGTGKTYAALFLSVALEVDRVIVISPKVAVDSVWKEEISDGFKKPQAIKTVFDNRPIEKNDKWILTNYEQARSLLNQIRVFDGDKVLIIVDESHNINTDTTLRTNNIRLLKENIVNSHIILLSGTPIKALPIEVLALFRLIDPKFTKTVSDVFRKMYKTRPNDSMALVKTRLGLVSFKVDKAVLELKEPRHIYHYLTVDRSERFLVSSVKEEMTKYMKERLDSLSKLSNTHKDRWTFIITSVEDKLDKKALQEYYREVAIIQTLSTFMEHGALLKRVNLYEKEAIMPLLEGEVKKEFRKLKSIVKYPQLVVVGEALGRVLGRRRIECNRELAGNYDFTQVIDNSLHKTLIFSNSVDVVRETQQRLMDRYDPLVITSSNSKETGSLIKEFETNKKNPLLSTFKLLSTAVRLTMADRMILIDFPYRAHELDQVQARIWRKGQDKTVEFHYLQLDTGDEPNLSTRTKDILQWSTEQIKSLTDVIVGDTGDDPGPSLKATGERLPLSTVWLSALSDTATK